MRKTSGFIVLVVVIWSGLLAFLLLNLMQEHATSQQLIAYESAVRNAFYAAEKGLAFACHRIPQTGQWNIGPHIQYSISRSIAPCFVLFDLESTGISQKSQTHINLWVQKSPDVPKTTCPPLSTFWHIQE